MNAKTIRRFIAQIILIEAAFMLPGLLLALIWGEHDALKGFLLSIGLNLLLALLLRPRLRSEKNAFHEKEALICVGLSWFIISLLGAMPFFLSREIPSFIDAFFETASGFTTTGASALSDVEALDKSLRLWRCLTHWLGGMGVLVFLLAVRSDSRDSGFTMHLLRAESPGPSVGKLVPRIRQTARILYCIYIALTLSAFIFLLFGGIPVFDAFCLAVSTAGTGGFAVTNAGLAGYSSYVQIVITAFMLFFSINFSCYYLLLKGNIKNVLADEELRFFALLYLGATAAVAVTVYPQYGNLSDTLRLSFFQTASIVSTTGFATADFALWPIFAQAVLLLLMMSGGCAGSTCGGIKCSRVILMTKNLSRNLRRLVRPSKIEVVRNNGEMVQENVLHNIGTYITAYVLILFGSFFLLCLNGFDLTTGFTAVLTCLNNVGPGFNAVGPMENFGSFSVLSKCILIFDMIAGRLEIFPVLPLFLRSTWKKS